ncbi:MAG: hypothetical protein KatS3mg131_3782 [Candidatus Tectimicrobiota bacterium]|nr:MAG: hypothetical protein KatS3mg131_3782 [Candidatus Tectomicrobia bacterium]
MRFYACAALAALLVLAPSVFASGLTPGELRSYATLHSIGIEWDIVGDTDHDAVAQVWYRPLGETNWRQAMPLFRVDFNGFNMLAGSILFLQPGTSYEVRLELADPDGGAASRTLTVATRPLPQLPVGGRTWHVVPGSGGGSGTAADPFRGIAAAQAAAQPGDVFLLHAGHYGGRVSFTVPGVPGRYIVWKGAGDGEAVFTGIAVAASHLWFEGLTIRDVGNGLTTDGAPEDVVVSRNTFLNCHYCIYLNGGGRAWYIADNVIVGDEPVDSDSLSGEGIELNHTSDHSVAYNRISNVADGISYPHVNVDIYGNDIFDTSDDGIEPDYGYANIRIWGNRIHNAMHNGISFQPMNSAPWYILRNQVINSRQSPLKLAKLDRVLLAHNTFVGWGATAEGLGRPLVPFAGQLRKVMSRNNLWVSITGASFLWEDGNSGEAPDWRTDLDYDGFDWHDRTRDVFKWLNVRYPDLASFAAATGLERHGIRIRKETCFETFNVPGPPPTPVPPQHLSLRADCAAVDAGAVLANLNDDFTGAAPDLGAYEVGKPLPHYGPRSATAGADTMPPAAPTQVVVRP